MSSTSERIIFSLVLVAIQVAAALPWLAVVGANWMSRGREDSSTYASRLLRRTVRRVGVAFLGGVLIAVLSPVGQDRENLEFYGGIYGAILHIQLNVDLFVVVFVVMQLIWPKGAAVAISAFRESWRQPMFWLIFILFVALFIITPLVPYFTFGEDHKVVKELGYDYIMLASALFAVLAASISISEEIEGRTAITLMSKPISRRQFLLGKYFGILMGAGMMTSLLSWVFFVTYLYKLTMPPEPQPPPIPLWLEDQTRVWLTNWGEVPAYFTRGAAFWLAYAAENMAGVILGFCQVMVLLAIAVALATRLPMVVNAIACLVIFFLGHLTPILTQVSQRSYTLVKFVAQTFDTVLPGLDLFNLGPSIARDAPPPAGPFAIYVGSVVLYAMLYTIIALLFGLILFEDRDLA